MPGASRYGSHLEQRQQEDDHQAELKRLIDERGIQRRPPRTNESG